MIMLIIIRTDTHDGEYMAYLATVPTVARWLNDTVVEVWMLRNRTKEWEGFLEELKKGNTNATTIETDTSKLSTVWWVMAGWHYLVVLPMITTNVYHF
jgi:hypothetical protein